ncbi:alpha/beta fold hydrolase [Azospirillum sp.]|uniref:alpha/beta fold hydrolase n=1 Tax=Azospirillum sp. TaxID=34012 RepID=UPI003D738882
MRPVVFDECFGWLHPAAGRRGVVLCGPLGLEAYCTHRAWRALAERLAAAGLPTLRFDYPGTGDSRGGDDDAARVRAWINGVHAAVRWMTDTLQLQEVALVGTRLGAALAAEAAAERGGVDRLVLLAPCSGAAFAAEVRAMARLAGAPQPDPDALEFNGFRLSAQTLADLKALDPVRLASAPAPRALLLARTDVRDAALLAGYLSGLGVAVDEEPFADYAALMRSVERGVVPEAPLERVAAWLAADAPAARAEPAPLPDAPPRLALPSAVETPVLFGPGGGLAGVWCEPAGFAPADRPALLLLPSGAWHHVGFARLSVEIARRLAAHGYASLRMDLSGLGDSASKTGQPDGLIYRRGSLADTRAALDWLEARGRRRCLVLGVCAGAALALHTALEDERVVGQVMINPGLFTLGDGATAEALGRDESHPAAFYLAQLGDPANWPRVVREAARRPGRLLDVPVALLRRVLRRFSGSAPQAAFRRLGARGVRTLLVYSAHDVSLGELEAHFGPGGAWFADQPGVWLETLPDADHNLTGRAARDAFHSLLDAYLAGDPDGDAVGAIDGAPCAERA